MNKKLKLFLSAKSNPQGTKFVELTKLAVYVGFVHSRTKGDHHQYKRLIDPKTLISFQPDNNNKNMAKGYQVKQLLTFIEDNDLQFLLED